MQIPNVSQEQFLGPYRLLRKLGEGGMGDVYLAHDEKLLRHAAVKVLKVRNDLTGRNNSAIARRFIREAQSAARLNHPHVVTIYQVGEQAGRAFLAMEYIEGGSLADRIRKAPLPWRTATQAVRDALLALEAAHDAGLIHRDIKPANLMVAKNRSIKLVDFGLARLLQNPEDGDITFLGAFVGSPSYASPEQIVASGKIDHRADLYSLAATWFALLTGQPPFVSDDSEELLKKHMTEPFPDLKAFAEDVPDLLRHVLMQASNKEPSKRYATAGEMREAVDAVLQCEGGHTVATSPLALVDTVSELETQLHSARSKSDSTTELATLRRLYGLYTQLDRREEALQAFREAIVVHVHLSHPGFASVGQN